ncbi:MAG: primosomal protein N', partial [Planctomycetota bacterium]
MCTPVRSRGASENTVRYSIRFTLRDVRTAACRCGRRVRDAELAQVKMGRTSDQLWLLPSEGEAREGMLADVALRLPTHRIHTYAVPDEIASQVRVGATLRVPYGPAKRPVEGWCVGIGRGVWTHTHRPVLEVLAGESILTEPLAELALWVADYYAARPGDVLDAMIPTPLRAPRRVKVRRLALTGEADGRRVTSRQQAVLDALRAGARPRGEVLAGSGVSPAVVGALIRRGLVREDVVESAPPAPPLEAGEPTPCAEDEYRLTNAQAAALEAITAVPSDETDAFGVYLLFGVPGSGKTEVYVRAIREQLARGRQAIVLVPEIALATQVVQRLAKRFARVAVLHSRLTPKARADSLRQIAAGMVDVVIGTRTAVFAPTPRLGLIVVDEEQDDSFKNIAAPFYHARDVAIKRAQIEHARVVLGSATPALETWFNATEAGRYRLLRLPQRAGGARLPRVELVAPEEPSRDAGRPLISPRLRTELTRVLASRRQAILLHNRRGYDVFLRCAECGLLVQCKRCGTHLIYHRTERLMKCHRCGARRAQPRHCLDDSCRGPLERFGAGIQRLEEEINAALPQARILRLDSDTMKRREHYAEALARFERHEADIMLGTQMVAKGLDFPNVALVGVLEADAALSMPDFRAAER